MMIDQETRRMAANSTPPRFPPSPSQFFVLHTTTGIRRETCLLIQTHFLLQILKHYKWFIVLGCTESLSDSLLIQILISLLSS